MNLPCNLTYLYCIVLCWVTEFAFLNCNINILLSDTVKALFLWKRLLRHCYSTKSIISNLLLSFAYAVETVCAENTKMSVEALKFQEKNQSILTENSVPFTTQRWHDNRLPSPRLTHHREVHSQFRYSNHHLRKAHWVQVNSLSCDCTSTTRKNWKKKKKRRVG